MEVIRFVGLVGLFGDDLGLGSGIQNRLLGLPAQNGPLQKILLPGPGSLPQRAALAVQGQAEVRRDLPARTAPGTDLGQIENLELPVFQGFLSGGGHNPVRRGLVSADGVGGFARCLGFFTGGCDGGLRGGGDGFGGLRCSRRIGKAGFLPAGLQKNQKHCCRRQNQDDKRANQSEDKLSG